MGGSIQSRNSRYELFLGDGNLVLYDRFNQQRIWDTGTWEANQGDMQRDGNFALYQTITSSGHQ